MANEESEIRIYNTNTVLFVAIFVDFDIYIARYERAGAVFIFSLMKSKSFSLKESSKANYVTLSNSTNYGGNATILS